MLADVTESHGAEQRIAERVQHHVAVRMRDDAAVVRNRDAAERDVCAGAECVDVVAKPDSHRASPGPQDRRGEPQVRRLGDLDVVGCARHQQRPQTKRLDGRGLVGDGLAALETDRERALQQAVTEHLRRRSAPEPSAVDRLHGCVCRPCCVSAYR